MNATTKTMAGALRTPRFAKTHCSQCGGDTGPGDRFHSSCNTHTTGRHTTSETMDASISDWLNDMTVHFDVDDDGDVHNLKVLIGESEITKEFSENQIEKLKYECWKNCLIEEKERNSDARIEAMRAEQEFA